MKYLSQTVFLLVISLAFYLGAGSVFAATTNVSITSTGFVPESITINAGDTVVWTNNDTTDHTATDDELTWDTDIIDPATTGSHVFSAAGTFTYSDTIDPTLTGSIIVRTATSGTTTPTPTPSPTPRTSTTSATVRATQPVSGVSVPTIIMLLAGAIFISAGFYSSKLNQN